MTGPAVFEIPPPDQHGARGANYWQGRDWTAIGRPKAAWQHHAKMTARSWRNRNGDLHGPPPFHVRLSIPLTGWKHADGHNYTSYEGKWIIDGLIAAGLIPGDTTDLLVVHDPTFRPKRSPQDGVKVTVGWEDLCPMFDTVVDNSDPDLPAPFCSDRCLQDHTEDLERQGTTPLEAADE